jgi:hypothetical protein
MVTIPSAFFSEHALAMARALIFDFMASSPAYGCYVDAGQIYAAGPG